MLPYNYRIYQLIVGLAYKCRGKTHEGHGDHSEHEGHGERNIVFLGFHKVAAMIVYQLKKDHSHLIDRMHVVDFNEKVLPKIREKGLTASYGDISSPDVLEHAVHGEVKIVLCTILDNLLRGTSNMKLFQVAKQVWPKARVIVISDNPVDTDKLYDAGADYVIMSSNLCADKGTEVLGAITGGFHAFCADEHDHHHIHHEQHLTGTRSLAGHVTGDSERPRKRRSSHSQIQFN